MIINDNELCHYGILGQKWGVRRYQNEDGSLTEAGKRRENAKNRKAVKKERIEASKNRSLLSDEELSARVKRLQQEKQLHDLTDQELKRGRRVARDGLDNVGKNTMQKALVEGIAATFVTVGAAYLKDYLTKGSGFGNGIVTL